ncbi:MAG: DUF805 domain-containing protein [Elusimicrobiaceae bacterium]|nr:DUF805 domain-containing protein [Elusimicrobiaceae bacterium]
MDDLKKYFMQYFWDVIKNQYFDFGGKATRKQFWLFFAWNYALYLLFYMGTQVIASMIFFVNEKVAVVVGIILMSVYSIISLALFIPNLAIQCRRFRDAGVSPWWLLLPFVLCGITSMVMLYAIGVGVLGGEFTHSLLAIIIITFLLCFLTLVAWLIVLILPSGFFNKEKGNLNIIQK